jgi:hypothetical protein
LTGRPGVALLTSTTKGLTFLLNSRLTLLWNASLSFNCLTSPTAFDSCLALFFDGDAVGSSSATSTSDTSKRNYVSTCNGIHKFYHCATLVIQMCYLRESSTNLRELRISSW